VWLMRERCAYRLKEEENRMQRCER
jgi:hypothetical protein